MYKEKRVLGVIPARGGSKRIPFKNSKLLGGKPLIAWTIETAISSLYLDKVVVSSDDEAIIKMASAMGCEVPFKRPACLATDQAKSEDVVSHVLENLPDIYDYVVLLQPTSPFRHRDDIDESISLCIDSKVPLVLSVRKARERPEWMCLVDQGGIVRYPYDLVSAEPGGDLYVLNGAVYVVDCRWFRENKVFRSPSARLFCMPWWRSVDIDTQEDWVIAELILEIIKSKGEYLGPLN